MTGDREFADGQVAVDIIIICYDKVMDEENCQVEFITSCNGEV